MDAGDCNQTAAGGACIRSSNPSVADSDSAATRGDALDAFFGQPHSKVPQLNIVSPSPSEPEEMTHQSVSDFILTLSEIFWGRDPEEVDEAQEWSYPGEWLDIKSAPSSDEPTSPTACGTVEGDASDLQTSDRVPSLDRLT